MSSLDSQIEQATPTREEFMRGEGFVFYTSVNNRLIEHASSQDLLPYACRKYDAGHYADMLRCSPGITQANLGLLMATHAITKSIPGLAMGTSFRDAMDISPEDIEATRSMGTHAAGLADREFPWYFAAGMADAAVKAFVREEKISAETAGQLTLGDWANLIGSGWFSKLMHNLAFTHNGIYQRFGANENDYVAGAIEEKIRSDMRADISIERNLLIVNEETEASDGATYLTASLDPVFRKALRDMMSKHDHNIARTSTGCPIARKTARVSKEYLATNPHVQELIGKGILAIAKDIDDNYVQVEQEYTAIDRTLLLFSDQLDRYSKIHGTPHIDNERDKVTHRYLPPTFSLMRIPKD